MRIHRSGVFRIVPTSSYVIIRFKLSSKATTTNNGTTVRPEHRGEIASLSTIFDVSILQSKHHQVNRKCARWNADYYVCIHVMASRTPTKNVVISSPCVVLTEHFEQSANVKTRESNRRSLRMPCDVARCQPSACQCAVITRSKIVRLMVVTDAGFPSRDK